MIETLFLPVVLTFLRVSAFVMFLPPFAGEYVPRSVKLGMVLALTFFWMPSISLVDVALAVSASDADIVADFMPEQVTDQPVVATEPAVVRNGIRRWVYWGYLAMRETTLGALLGWTLGMILMPLRITGSWIADQLGLTMAEVTAGIDNGASNVVAMFVETVGVLLLFTLSVHHNFLRIFSTSIDQYAIGQPWEFPQVGRYIELLNRLPAIGIQIAGPMTLVSVLVVVALIFAMKQSPQFNWFGFGMTTRLGVGLLTLVFVFPSLLANILSHLESFLIS